MNNLTELAAKFNIGVKTVLVQTADVAGIPLPSETLGTLTPAVQQIMMAQRQLLVNQSAVDFTIERGIGLLGLNILQLYDLGLIKPQIFDAFTSGNTNIGAIGLVPDSLTFDQTQVYDAVNLSTTWTGLYAVNAIQDILTRPALQYTLLQDSYILSYNALLNANIIAGTENIETLSMAVTLTSIYGLIATAEFLGQQL